MGFMRTCRDIVNRVDHGVLFLTLNLIVLLVALNNAINIMRDLDALSETHCARCFMENTTARQCLNL
jgi:hypothetical protein